MVEIGKGGQRVVVVGAGAEKPVQPAFDADDAMKQGADPDCAETRFIGVFVIIVHVRLTAGPMFRARVRDGVEIHF